MSNTVASNNVSPSLGQKLQKARQEAKLRPEDVAQSLRLNVKIINALENDDYSGIAAPTYARGYLRSYAQLLHINDADILDIFDKIKPAFASNGAAVPAYDVCEAKRVTISVKTTRILSFLVALILVVLIFIWSFSHRANNETEKTIEPTKSAVNSPSLLPVVQQQDSEQVKTPISINNPEDLKQNLDSNKESSEAVPSTVEKPKNIAPVNKVQRVLKKEQKNIKRSSSIIVDHSI